MPETVIDRLDAMVTLHGERPAIAGLAAEGWVTTSWADYRAQVRRAAAGFVALGVEPGTGVTILAANRPEWAIADLGAIAAGGIPTGVFTTSSPEQCRYLVDHTAARVAVVDGDEALAKLAAVRAELPLLGAIVKLDGERDEPGVVSWRRLLELGAAAGEEAVRERLAAQRPDDVATLIYTSGTTGTPKGVELTHRNLVWMAARGAEVAHRLGAEERQLSYLPLAHIAEQMLALHLPLASGSCVHFVSELERVPEALREVRPTHFFAVPRVWEKLQAAVTRALAEASPLRRALVGWARRQGARAGAAGERGAAPPLAFALAERVVLRRVRARLGLDRAGFCASAAAPISRATLDFFFSLGLPVLEVYGLSETTGVITVSLPESYRIGAVGRPLPGIEMRVAEDGEILARGPNVFRGYRHDPAATAAAIEPDGWLHTGDVGTLDADGFLRITDRKKELLVTSGGKKVAPAPIENRLREIAGVAHAVLVGEQRHYVAALLTLDSALLPTLASRLGSAARSLKEAAGCPIVRRYLDREIARVNTALARFESVRRFAVLDEEFSIPGGELTPTLKIKRRVVYQKYGGEIEALYSAEG